LIIVNHFIYGFKFICLIKKIISIIFQNNLENLYYFIFRLKY